MCSREAVLVAVIILPVLGLAQQDQKKIHYESAKPTSSAAGSAMYKSYCASCHGIIERAMARHRERSSGLQPT